MLVDSNGRHAEDGRDAGSASACYHGMVLLHDLTQVLRILATSLLPMMLLTVGGAGFVLKLAMLPRYDACNVQQLQEIAAQGHSFSSFACDDGFVATNMQLGAPAWKGSHVVHSDFQHLAFAAPVFDDQQALIDGKAPVAWAVKAGRPVKTSQCQDSRGAIGLCGFFQDPLKVALSNLSSPIIDGESFGLNITHANRDDFLAAIVLVQRKYPKANLPLDPTTVLVVVETIQEYFGTAYSFAWVTATLFGIGILDRVNGLLGYDTPEENQGPKYQKMHRQDEPSDHTGDMISELASFWADPLNPHSDS